MSSDVPDATASNSWSNTSQAPMLKTTEQGVAFGYTAQLPTPTQLRDAAGRWSRNDRSDGGSCRCSGR